MTFAPPILGNPSQSHETPSVGTTVPDAPDLAPEKGYPYLSVDFNSTFGYDRMTPELLWALYTAAAVIRQHLRTQQIAVPDWARSVSAQNPAQPSALIGLGLLRRPTVATVDRWVDALGLPGAFAESARATLLSILEDAR